MSWSDEIYRIHGYEPGVFVPTREAARAAYHPADRQRVAGEIASALAGAAQLEFRARILRPDGDERHVLVRGFTQGGDGTGRTLFGIIMDVTDQVRGETQLREVFERLRFALDAGRMFAWDRDHATGQVRRSENAQALLGFVEGGTDRFMAQVHAADRERVADAAAAALLGHRSYSVEFRFKRADGSTVWLSDVGRLIDEGGRRRLTGICSDVTARREAEDGCRRSDERLALALEGGSDGWWDWDLVTGSTWFSDRWEAMLGYKPGELPGHVGTWRLLVHPDDRAGAMRLLADHMEARAPVYECEHRVLRQDGSYAWVLARGKVVERGDGGRAVRIVGTHIDVSARKEAELQVAHLARHDPLTDLPNRASFLERLRQALSETRRHDDRFAVLSLDLSGLRAVNDALGHAAGDRVLREAGRRIKDGVRGEDLVARLGGDEFGVLQAGIGGEAVEPAALAARLIELVGAPFDLDGTAIDVGLSVGLAITPSDGTDADELLRSADAALQRAKLDGRNAVRTYDRGMDAAVQEQRQLELMLRGALGRGELTLHYQPIVSSATGRVTGFEALLRWFHPERGPVSPAVFIPLAEESGLIVGIGDWVLRAACAEAARWTAGMKVAVNVSPVQFRRGSLAVSVASALADSGLPPESLELEMTESVLVQHDDELVRTLQRLRELGIGLALDDFGTGYSSLSYLSRFPFSRIKIDRSFVAGLGGPHSAAIVRAVIELGRQFHMSVTAEGVETAEQRDTLRAAGCPELQGYLFSPARPAQDIPAMLALRPGRSRRRPARRNKGVRSDEPQRQAGREP